MTPPRAVLIKPGPRQWPLVIAREVVLRGPKTGINGGRGKTRERERETMENTRQRVALLAVHNEVRSIGKVSIYCFSLDLENIVNNGEVGECNKFVSFLSNVSCRFAIGGIE